jgi:ADP-heptose:LPS heptosyltransferase
VVRLSSIGDVVHTLPALAALHRHGWDVDWLLEPPGLPLVEGNPLVARTLALPPARALSLPLVRQTRRALRAAPADVALDFQGLWKSALWARLSGAPRVVGYRRAERKEGLSALLMTEQVRGEADATHVIDKNLALLAPLGIVASGPREFPLPTPAVARTTVDAGLAALGMGDFAILNPGGGWAGKLWPAEAFGALARGLRARGLESLVSWGPGEEALADRVVAASEGAARRAFPTALLDYVELARRARLVVSGDTGPLHLACAVGTPVVALFGPTDPARNGPFAAADLVVRRLPPCAPCYRRGCSQHAGVMSQIPVEEVTAAVQQRLAAAREGPR